MTFVLERNVTAALVGVHVGDALGAAVEFDDAATIARRFPGGVREIVGGGPFGWQPGQPTDDTDLTWAIARGYLEAVHRGQAAPVVRDAIADAMADAMRTVEP